MVFKVLTHDYRPPVQGGKPVFDGTLPCELPKIRLDTSAATCGAGWNYAASLATALRIAHLWPDGRPVACFEVKPSKDAIERGNKRRCSQLTLIRRCDREEIRAAILELSQPFGEHAEAMADSQLAWSTALGRPERDEAEVETGLRVALAARGLDWGLKSYGAARDAWAAWAAWAARAARDAWAALTIEFASLQGWIEDPADLLTVGIRAAYERGLEIAVPVAKDTLGYAVRVA